MGSLCRGIRKLRNTSQTLKLTSPLNINVIILPEAGSAPGQWRIRGGGVRRASPLFFGEYFKKSLKLVKIYKKIKKKPGAPLFSDPGSATDSPKINETLFPVFLMCIYVGFRKNRMVRYTVYKVTWFNMEISALNLSSPLITTIVVFNLFN